MLLALVYDELRRLAASVLRRERQGMTLQPTELVHEAFLKLVVSPLPSFEDRRHFFGIAARAMRQLLVDHARTRGRKKRRGPEADRTLDQAVETPGVSLDHDEILTVHHALDRLAEEFPKYARIVELRYFGGFSLEETAEIIGLSRATVARQWALARSLLQEALNDG